MRNRYDVYITDSRKALVYERGEISECGDLPYSPRVYESDQDGDWEEWVEEHTDWRDNERVRVCRRKAMLNAGYVKDLEAKAQGLLDDYRAAGSRLGWGRLDIDTSWVCHTYRASADWKNEPTRYTFDQRLAWENPPKDYADTDALFARDLYVRLIGMADAAYELGLSLVFDKDFKVSVCGVRAKWEVENDL